MRAFVKYAIFIFLGIILISVCLDIVFTKVYENAEPRTKFQYLRSLKGKKMNYIFLGSSRVENSIIPELIEKETGKKAINLGFQASKLSDIYTALKLIKAYNIKSDKIAIQVDYIYNIEEGHSKVFQYELMPFIRENEVTQDYFDRYLNNEKEIYYVPFYRYLRFESKIGFREFFLNLMNKKTKVILNQGFVGLKGNSTRHGNTLPDKLNSKNIYIEKIKEFAAKNDLQLLFYCAPFCRHTKNLDFTKKLKLNIPELYDFSTVINDDKMFQNCSHLNQEGASYFTKQMIHNMLIHK